MTKSTTNFTHHAERISKAWCTRDTIAIIAIGIVIGAVFYKTIFLGQAVSRICLVAARDVIFREFLAPATEIYYDESASQLFVPAKFLTSIYLKNKWLPLWNPYSGCGTPFLADIQSYALSPWSLLFSVLPTMQWLNLLIVAQVIISAIGTYYLTRVLGVSILASILASLCYSLCPRNLEWTELISASLLPFVFLAFALVSKQGTKQTIIFASMASSLLIVSAHPEVSFIGITHASLLLALLNLFKKAAGQSLLSIGIRTGLTLAAIAMLTFALSAPLLLPFIEFLKNSESYKFDSTHHVDSAFYWQWFLVNLLQPADRGNSPFLGAIVPVLIAPSLLKGTKRKTAICLLVTALTAALLGCRPGLIGNVLFDTVLNFDGTYYLPVTLLMLCSCAALGLDVTLKATEEKDSSIIKWLFLGCLAVLLTPPLIDHIQALKTAYQQPVFRPRDLINNLCVFIGFAIAFILSRRKTISVRIFTLITLILSLISVLIAARWSLPGQGKFAYSKEAPLTFLQKNPGRSLGIGWDVLRSGSNMVYQISSLSMFNVLFPSRYRSFMRAAGGEVSTFNVLMVQRTLSHLLDLASVKYIVSLEPITGEYDPKFELKTINIAQSKEAAELETVTVRLIQAKIAIDQARSQFSGSLVFSLPRKQLNQYAFNVIVSDEHGNQIWFGGLNAIPATGNRNKDGTLSAEVPFAGIVPYHRQRNKKAIVAIKVFDTRTLKSNQGATAIYTVDGNSTNFSNTLNQYKLIDEFPPHHIRIYENQTALPRAYIAHKAQIALSGVDALKAISAKNFNCQNSAILEGVSPSQVVNASSNLAAEPATLTKDLPNNLSIEVNSRAAGILILTDVFYPGWNAILDGKEVPIYRANYLFRGVLIPAGKHTIEFTYFPSSFVIGLCLSLGATVLALAITGYELFGKAVVNHSRKTSS